MIIILVDVTLFFILLFFPGEFFLFFLRSFHSYGSGTQNNFFKKNNTKRVEFQRLIIGKVFLWFFLTLSLFFPLERFVLSDQLDLGFSGSIIFSM